LETAEQYRARAAEMRAMAKKVQRDLAARYLELADAYDHLALQREELVAVRAKLDQTLIGTDPHET
jgi:hypothetical protein